MKIQATEWKKIICKRHIWQNEGGSELIDFMIEVSGSSPWIGFSGQIVSEWDAGDTISKIAPKRMFDVIMCCVDPDLRIAGWMK